MSVGPDRLYGVAADAIDLTDLEGERRKRLLGPFVEISHHIDFPFATGAGTIPPQHLEPDKTFRSVIPLDGEFIAYLLNVLRSHGLKPSLLASGRRLKGSRELGLVHSQVKVSFQGEGEISTFESAVDLPQRIQ